MHIAIIGAGISGLLSALELVEQGCSISIFDQQQAAQAASWAGSGILSPMYPWRYPQAVNDLAQFAKPQYQAWNEKLKPITGIDFEIHETGMLIFDEDDFDFIGSGARKITKWEKEEKVNGIVKWTDRLYNEGNLTEDFLKKNLLLPIPDTERDANPGITDNNFGYW